MHVSKRISWIVCVCVCDHVPNAYRCTTTCLKSAFHTSHNSTHALRKSERVRDEHGEGKQASGEQSRGRVHKPMRASCKCNQTACTWSHGRYKAWHPTHIVVLRILHDQEFSELIGQRHSLNKFIKALDQGTIFAHDRRVLCGRALDVTGRSEKYLAVKAVAGSFGSTYSNH